MESVEIKIIRKIKRDDRGKLFFANMFSKFGNAKAVNKALERLVQQGKLYRITTGIYVLPFVSEYVGNIFPDIDTIAVAIAKRDRAKIVPTGSYALNRLGFSTQVPMNIVYLTDGAARTVKVRKFTIKFKKTTPRNVSAIGKISKLVIQALRTIGKNYITDEEIKQIHQILKHEKPTHLEHDIWLAPAWIREIMKSSLKSETDG
jgi:hypothetical protein